eukprot:m.163164 g.163164  ORF g.163164 m.163164 type:complete len:83 (-) comp31279_c5_seq5:217-465(-)
MRVTHGYQTHCNHDHQRIVHVLRWLEKELAVPPHSNNRGLGPSTSMHIVTCTYFVQKRLETSQKSSKNVRVVPSRQENYGIS